MLLRPPGWQDDDRAVDDDDFYSFRFSLLLPNWSRRCREPGFRNLAVETLRMNAPAHLLPEIHWLDFAGMVEFERLYRDWRDCRSDSQVLPSQLDASSVRLAEFLRDLRRGAKS